MAVQKLREDLYYVGAIDWDRRLFDELIPLPDGTSYNAYLIKGTKKTALIDTVDPRKKHELLDNLKELKVKTLDYVIANHAEQDHSGTLPQILKQFPEAQLVTNTKCKTMLMDAMLLPESRFKTVEDREKLSLGKRTLEFIFAPWVHWPETMLTYLPEERILFPCDFRRKPNSVLVRALARRAGMPDLARPLQHHEIQLAHPLPLRPGSPASPPGGSGFPAFWLPCLHRAAPKGAHLCPEPFPPCQ